MSEDLTFYDWEFYVSRDFISLLGTLLLFGLLLFSFFMILISTSGMKITKEMILIYGSLSFAGSFGFLLVFILIKHPNKYVRRITWGILFASPLLSHFL